MTVLARNPAADRVRFAPCFSTQATPKSLDASERVILYDIRSSSNPVLKSNQSVEIIDGVVPVYEASNAPLQNTRTEKFDRLPLSKVKSASKDSRYVAPSFFGKTIVVSGSMDAKFGSGRPSDHVLLCVCGFW